MVDPFFSVFLGKNSALFYSKYFAEAPTFSIFLKIYWKIYVKN